MAYAVARRLQDDNLAFFECSFVEPSKDRRLFLNKNLNASFIELDDQDVSKADAIVLATKPEVIQKVAVQAQHLNLDSSLIVSIAAGVSVSDLKRYFRTNACVRLMPNVNAQIGCSASGIF